MSYANEVSRENTAVLNRRIPRGAPQLAVELRVTAVHLYRRLRAELATDKVSSSQFSVLSMLDRQGPATPREIAKHEQVQPPSMTRTIGLLTDLNLVERQGHPEDGRQVLISLTQKGKTLVAETRKRRDAWLARQLRDLTPAERETLANATEILRRLTAQ